MAGTAREEERLRAEVARLRAKLEDSKRGRGAKGLAFLPNDALRWLAPVIVENLTDGAYVTAKDGRLVYANRGAREMLGYEEAEMLSMSIFDVDPGLTREIWDAVWGVTRRVRKHTIESQHRTKDGRLVPVEILANAIEVDGVEYSCAFARDISERRNLEALVSHSEQMEAIGHLAGGIAHDFNNQLAGIVGCADLLRLELGDNPRLTELAAGILTAATRASQLTNRLVAFARKGKSLSTVVDLHPIVHEVAGMLKRSLDKRIVLRSELCAEPALTIGDPSQLQNAVLNLAINARDAMPDGGTLTFATELVVLEQSEASFSLSPLDPGRYVRVGVADTGVGMDAETRQRIFEPFFTTKKQGRGTGMGLAAVHGTMKNHHGAIRVHSEPGRGTRFELFLPRAQGAVPEPATGDFPDSLEKLDARVLLVEDEAVVHDTTARMLSYLGCHVATARSGRDAIALYQDAHEQIDVVILDLMMPGMSGKATFLLLREISSQVAVILISGYAFDGEVQLILDHGARAPRVRKETAPTAG